MSLWDKLQLEDKIVEILKGVRYHKQHHFARSYLTAYQLAIAFSERYRIEFKQIGYPIGGKGIGQHTSLAQYLTGQLSRGIKAKRITKIEALSFLKTQAIKLQPILPMVSPSSLRLPKCTNCLCSV